MDLLAFLRTLKRRWVLILALTVVGAVLGAASTKLNEKKADERTYYKATTTIVVDTSSNSGSAAAGFQNLDQLAIRATTGEVPDAVAKKLGSDKSGRELAQQIVTTTNQSTSTLAITAASPSADEAVSLANTFSDELISDVNQRAQDAYNQSRDKLQSRLDDLTNAQNALYGQIAANPPDVDNKKAQLEALVNQYRLTYDSYSQLAAQGPPTSLFSVLQKAASVPIGASEYNSRINLGATSRNNLSTGTGDTSSTDSAIATAPTSSSFQSTTARGVLGAFLGLLLGMGLALVLDRFDRRIRTRPEAEEAYTLPVLAEVPQLKKSQQKEFEVAITAAPLSRFAEAYRAVRSSILFTRAAMADDDGRAVDRTREGAEDTLFTPDHDEPLVVMVTSAAPNEGKTTTTANLAAVFAEAGSSVLIVNCDFRRPSIHRYFGVEDVPRSVQETNVPGVKIVTNVLSDPGSNPTQVVAAQRQVVAAARGRFDVILLDTAPLLTANDAVDLVSAADLVLLVARLGLTRSDNAERTMDLLNRLDVPIAGVVLIGAASATNDYYYYYQPGRVNAPGAVPAAVGVRPEANGKAETKADKRAEKKAEKAEKKAKSADVDTAAEAPADTPADTPAEPSADATASVAPTDATTDAPTDTPNGVTTDAPATVGMRESAGEPAAASSTEATAAAAAATLTVTEPAPLVTNGNGHAPAPDVLFGAEPKDGGSEDSNGSS